MDTKTERTTPKRAPKRAVQTAEGGTRSSSKVDLASLDELVGYSLRRAHHAQLQRFAAVFGQYDVRPVQLSILGVVYHNPAIKQFQLARAMDIKRTNIVALLDELEQRSLLRRRRAHDDKRSHVIHLTPAGKKFTKKMLDLHAQLERDMAESLGPRDRDRLLQLLKNFRRLDPAPDLGKSG